MVFLYSPNEWPSTLDSPYEKIKGHWVLIGSTHPMWKSSTTNQCDTKNICFDYCAISGEASTTFDEVLSFNKATDKVGASPVKVKSVSKLESGAVKALWKSKGKGVLNLAKHQWQLLGVDSFEPGPSDWLVLYNVPSKFGGGAINLLARNPGALNNDKYDEVRSRLEGLGGDIEDLLSRDGGMYRVPHDAV